MAGVAALLMLAGCGTKEPEGPASPIDSEQLNAIASTGPTVAEVLAAGNDATPAAARPVAFDYHGDWATNATLCRRSRWRFAKKTVDMGDATRCTIDMVDPRADSEVRLDVTCQPASGGIRTAERWSLVRRDNGEMIVARTAGNGVPESVTLARCA